MPLEFSLKNMANLLNILSPDPQFYSWLQINHDESFKIPQSHPKPIESEMLGVGPEHLHV